MGFALLNPSYEIRSVLHIIEAETVAPALDVADRGRREVHRAAQRVGVAVALEKAPAGLHRLVAVGVDAHHQLRIARLDRRMNEVTGEHRLVMAAAGADRKMVG